MYTTVNMCCVLFITVCTYLSLYVHKHSLWQENFWAKKSARLNSEMNVFHKKNILWCGDKRNEVQ